MHGAGHGWPFCIPLLWFIQNDSKQGIPLKSKSDYFHLTDEAGVPLAYHQIGFSPPPMSLHTNCSLFVSVQERYF